MPLLGLLPALPHISRNRDMEGVALTLKGWTAHGATKGFKRILNL